ncbi:hypothetical protein ACHAXM_011723 [Skeletonema potamos]
MSSSPSLNNIIVFVIALIALFLHTQQMHVSAFAPVPSSSAITRRDVSCNAFNNGSKKASSSKKQPAVSGIGGLNTARKSSGKPKTTPKKNVPPPTAAAAKKKKSAVSAPVKKTQPTGSVFRVKMSEETPWSTILVSFLIPWRNPNSIFLYLLIIVSVLGKMNEK